MYKDKHIYEGWYISHFIKEIEPIFNIVGNFESKQQLKEWLKSEQPYYKKHIPEVYKYFLNKTNL